MKATRITPPPWHNGCVCWVEIQQPDGSWERCNKTIGKKAKRLRNKDGSTRSPNSMRRTCWWHRGRENEASEISQ